MSMSIRSFILCISSGPPEFDQCINTTQALQSILGGVWVADGSRRLLQADGPAMAKAWLPYVLSQWREGGPIITYRGLSSNKQRDIHTIINCHSHRHIAASQRGLIKKIIHVATFAHPEFRRCPPLAWLPKTATAAGACKAGATTCPSTPEGPDSLYSSLYFDVCRSANKTTSISSDKLQYTENPAQAQGNHFQQGSKIKF